MQNTRISWSESCVLVALCLGPAPAHAQFGFINNLLQPFMRSAERFFRSNTATNHTQAASIYPRNYKIFPKYYHTITLIRKMLSCKVPCGVMILPLNICSTKPSIDIDFRNSCLLQDRSVYCQSPDKVCTINNLSSHSWNRQ